MTRGNCRTFQPHRSSSATKLYVCTLCSYVYIKPSVSYKLYTVVHDWWKYIRLHIISVPYRLYSFLHDWWKYECHALLFRCVLSPPQTAGEPILPPSPILPVPILEGSQVVLQYSPLAGGPPRGRPLHNRSGCRWTAQPLPSAGSAEPSPFNQGSGQGGSGQCACTVTVAGASPCM